LPANAWLNLDKSGFKHSIVLPDLFRKILNYLRN